jgi:two-component system phosphate regulon sensor histidine kinase PhoR
MDAQFLLLILPRVLAMVVLCALGMYGAGRIRTHGSVFFTLIMFGGSIWAFAATAEVVSGGFEVKRFWLDLRFSITPLLLTGWVASTLRITHYPQWLRHPRRIMVGLGIPLFIVVALNLTNPVLHLVRASEFPVTQGTVTVIRWTQGPLYLLDSGYIFAMSFISFSVLLSSSRRVNRLTKSRSLIIFLAMLPTIIATAINRFGSNPFSILSQVPLMFLLSALIITWGLFRVRLLDVRPIARNQVLENMDDGVMVVDLQGGIVDFNPVAQQMIEAVSGRTATLGMKAGILFPGWSLWAEGFQRADTRTQFDAPAGEREYDVRIAPLRSQRHIVGQIAILRDITERKQAERQTIELETERQRRDVLESFLRAASHDLRTPITIINTSAYLMDRMAQQFDGAGQNGASIDSLRGKVQTIQECARRLETIVESMLEISRLENTANFQFTALDLSRFADEVAQGYQAVAARKELWLSTEFTKEAVPVQVDITEFSKALKSLLDNAVQYTPAGGKITLRTGRNEHQAYVEVADTGIGIAPDHLPRVFERFYRVDPARSAETGGAGLGLAITQQIVRIHGGQLTASSVQGQGSTFRIGLPVIKPAEIG